ncbi:MAG: ABC transporter permease, partial [Hungatella sp.]
MISTVLTAYCFHMAYYCLLYTTAVLVMMLTGNIIIALLGIVVFFVYGPGVTLLISGYNQVWWETYIPMKDYGPNAIYEKLMMHTSPFFNYIKNLETDTSGHLLALTAMVLLVTLVLAVCACLLYQKRPSEAAGQALAFPKSKMPIKVLLVVPIALICSLFFWELRSTMPWAIFGLLCGAVVTHCLMEIIYHFDFRKLFS